MPGEVKLAKALEDVLAERRRQIEVEGWTPEHDDEHTSGEMAQAAACYAVSSTMTRELPALDMVTSVWPWSLDWWKPKGRRTDLIRAAALIVAEIERIDRAALATGSHDAQ